MTFLEQGHAVINVEQVFSCTTFSRSPILLTAQQPYNEAIFNQICATTPISVGRFAAELIMQEPVRNKAPRTQFLPTTADHESLRF